MKKTLVNLAKLALSLAILAYLVRDVLTGDPESFRRLSQEPKQWGLLAAACGAILLGTFITYVRWYWLVRALDIPFRLRDAFRLGSLGYMLNLVSIGSVGGDFFKAVFIAREQPRFRTEAVATIIADRLVGVLGLLLVAAVTVLLADLTPFGPDIVTLGRMTVGAAALLLLVLVVLMLPGWHDSQPMQRLRCLRRVGPIVGRLLDAVHAYRRQRHVLYLAVAVSMVGHAINVVGFYWIAQGLSRGAPGLLAHFVIIPLALSSGAIPLPFGALGAFEWVIDTLYEKLHSPGLGLLVALSYRVVTIVVASIGAVVYLVSRREMSDVLHEAEAEASAS